MPTNKKLTPEMEANRCAISASNCDEARKYLDVYQGLKEKDNKLSTDEFFTLREGLLLAAIVSYSRAFIPSHGEQFAAQMIDVDLSTVFRNDASKIKLHKTILERRNNAVAHATWKYHKTKVLEDTAGTGVLRMHAVVDYGEGINIKVFRNMAATMRDYFQHGAFDRDVATGAKPKKEVPLSPPSTLKTLPRRTASVRRRIEP